jgi:uncharacterized protein (DUF2141 family)
MLRGHSPRRMRYQRRPSPPFWLATFALAGIGACAALRSRPRSAGVARASTAPSTAPSTAQVTATLTVIVKDLRNRKGDLIFGVFTQADGFPNVQAKSVYWEVKSADAAAVTFTAHLPPGRYAAGVLHDENKSGDMDKGVGGIPLEGYGVTNNPKPRFRKARFDEATFDLPPEGASLAISLQYF